MTQTQMSFLDAPPAKAEEAPKSLESTDRGELARRFLACDHRSEEYELLLNALSTKDVPRRPK